jgi:hypothetical protein
MNEMLKRALESWQNGYALPGVLYRDAELYEEEIREIYMKSWLYAGHQSQIPKRGQHQRAHERLPPPRIAYLRYACGT